MKALLAFLYALFAVLSPAAVSSAYRTGGEISVAQEMAAPDDCACCEVDAGAAVSCASLCHAALTAAAFAVASFASSSFDVLRSMSPLAGLTPETPAPPPR